tara:strand:- start:1707 stop:2027 length:321 start_codon:yes stop_codon:yes gene_type:complete
MSEIPKFTAVKGSTVAKVLEKVGHATVSTLVKLTGRPIKSVLSTIKTLHDRSKVHIGAYEFNKRGQVSRVWYWGDGDDVREPVMSGNKQVFIPRSDVAAAWLRNPV